MKVSTLTVLVAISTFSGIDCWFWGINWFWNSAASRSENRAIEFVGDVPVANVPYEAKTDDEKFLDAAKQYTNLQLSELDTCQHKIVLQIRTSCSEMTEEDIAKMSVNLLNCQSAIEERQQFPCTADMSLKDCTSSMDPDMWNAYHLISNRARAVCYAARQQQFRAQSDIAVNKLMQTAYSQLSTMEKLKEGQQKLEQFSVETFQTVASGQESLLQQQERMRVTQQSLQDFVGLNLRELTREKALIAAGHKELSKMTLDIKAKLDSASAQLVEQTSERKDNQQQLVKDLNLIKEQATNIWNEIELSTLRILAQHETASVKYDETLDKLAKINETVKYLLNLMETMQNDLSEHLGWLNGLVGAAGIYSIFMHIIYLLLGMIATAYVQASAFTRLSLLVIVPLNLAVLYHHGSDAALDFISMSMIIVVSSAVHWLTVNIMLYNNNRKKSSLERSHFRESLDEKVKSHNINIQCQIKSWWDLLKDEISKHIYHIKSWSSKAQDGHVPRYRSENRIDHDNDMDDEDYDGHSSHDGSERSASIPPFVLNRESQSSERRFQPISRESVTPLHRLVSPMRNYVSPPTPPRSLSSSITKRAASSRPGTPRPLCIATCRNGLLCRNTSLVGSEFCHTHQHDVAK